MKGRSPPATRGHLSVGFSLINRLPRGTPGRRLIGRSDHSPAGRYCAHGSARRRGCCALRATTASRFPALTPYTRSDDSYSSRTRAQSPIPFDLAHPFNQSLSPQPKLAAIEPRISYYASRSDSAGAPSEPPARTRVASTLLTSSWCFRDSTLSRAGISGKTVPFHAYVPESVTIARLGQ
jgi:hypothetical protein